MEIEKCGKDVKTEKGKVKASLQKVSSESFDNVYYFSNAFKKYYGLSPLNYKKRL